MGEIGPMKKFRNKKAMWTFVMELINTRFNIERTLDQVKKILLGRKEHNFVFHLFRLQIVTRRF